MAQSVVEIVAEFNRQRAANPATADRSLLEAGRRLLQEQLQQSCWEPHIVHSGFALLHRLGDYSAITDLLSRYLLQSLSVDEEAWARWHLIDNVALCGRCEAAVAGHREFLRRAQEVFPKHPPSLERDIPFYPAGERARTTLSKDSLLAWVMGDGTQAMCWIEVGRGDEWLEIFYDIMAATPATAENRFRRFNYLRTASVVASMMGRVGKALEITQRVGALAGEEASREAAQRWTMEAHILEIRVHQEAQNTEEVRRTGRMAITLIEEYAREQDSASASESSRLRSFRHNTAATLYRAGQYDLATPLLRRVIECGTPLPWPYIWLAASLWATTRNRSEVLALLQQATHRTRGDCAWDECRKLPEFQEVAEDPEFQRAATFELRLQPNTRGG
jgi:hypothetical protein